MSLAHAPAPYPGAALIRDEQLRREYIEAGLPEFQRAGYGTAPRNMDAIGKHLDSIETLLREIRTQYEAGRLRNVASGARIIRHHFFLIMRVIDRRGHL